MTGTSARSFDGCATFLDRLTPGTSAEDFALKGGIVLAAYGVRRPTKDADAIADGTEVTADPSRRGSFTTSPRPRPMRVVVDLDSIVAEFGKRSAD